ncbi:DUF5082 domain-containing protein [Parageobacillus thermoglucosidasius]|uniref:DUF5082 domain-containing protein n=1 Tax=Parageobacillus thermoglucosidasius TaxID=1426 RepID=UPI000E171ED9|nr:DUF5082 domain-containing protein [Parageobacillus thermoglucosidasius]MED4906216.1 DUF5082 domain-containing protein [Parageobacillus thermoglucosidasius]MED4913175.1 DUF5082 domain-containing protein [Parageobacillus thermoglucosidasius]MED4944757.1 DUF5082 domain-containing protein [Parageobacillus thermoglucosidasius]MED4984649.1 DUF5082 domain-containing protein [Parageobacillus thermoglucosidasius]RDE27352.1 DUF5082 domain-containing protein [Parageobacillus thermoglucosidasius]
MASLSESIEQEVKRRACEVMMDYLKSYQGQVEEAIGEFRHGTHAFYHASAKNVPHWQGEPGKAHEPISGNLRQIEARIDTTADELLHEISREIAQIRRKIEELQ